MVFALAHHWEPILEVLVHCAGLHAILLHPARAGPLLMLAGAKQGGLCCLAAVAAQVHFHLAILVPNAIDE